VLGFYLHELITGGPRFYSLLRITFSNPAQDARELIFTESPTVWKFYGKFGLGANSRRIDGSECPGSEGRLRGKTRLTHKPLCLCS
jgi:hypothetical protein